MRTSLFIRFIYCNLVGFIYPVKDFFSALTCCYEGDSAIPGSNSFDSDAETSFWDTHSSDMISDFDNNSGLHSYQNLQEAITETKNFGNLSYGNLFLHGKNYFALSRSSFRKHFTSDRIEFIHLHNHSHFSLLDAISTIDGLVNAAVEFNMPAVALTDHGVMYGIMEFYKKAKQAGIKPIVGCEVYVAQSGTRFDKGKKFLSRTSEDFDDEPENSDGLVSSNINYAHLILLAKNEAGYRNLIKLTSAGHTEGYYYKPRIDLDVLNTYRKALSQPRPVPAA